MAPLDYASPPDDRRPSAAPLIALPFAALAVTVIVVGHNLWAEPFPVFSIVDALIQVGGPVGVLALWIVWSVIARRQRRPRRVDLVVTLAWAALNLWAAGIFATAYFDELWNR
jgi:hypothetical protein